jgi:multidrug resistance efflux pump
MRKHRCFFLPAGALALAGLVVCVAGAAWALKDLQAAPPAVAAPPPALPAVVCVGYVDVESGVASLAPLGPGRVTRVEAHENQTVQAGTVLVRLDDRQARLRAREARADLEAARGQLAEAKKLPDRQQTRVAQQRAAVEAAHHRLSGARQDLARQRDLEKARLVDPREVAAAEAKIQELEALERAEQGKLRELGLIDPWAGLERARAEVDARQARLEQANRSVDECLLRAPEDGTVLRILVRPGDVLAAPAGQPAVLFCPRQPRLIRAEVAQELAGRVAVGQAASARDDTTDDAATWAGKVLRVSDWYTRRRSILREPLERNDVRTLECLIALDPGQPPVRVGQRMRATILPDAPFARTPPPEGATYSGGRGTVTR